MNDTRLGEPSLTPLVDAGGAGQPGRTVRHPTRRLHLGWTASTLPVAPLLMAGVFMGPQGLSLLTPGALAAIDPAIPVALAALGILIGLEVGERRASAVSKLPFGAAQALFTAGVVASGIYATARFGLPSMGIPWLLPAVCGVCAASSLTLPGRLPSEPRRHTDSLMELEVAVAIVGGALVLALARRSSAESVGLVLVQGTGVVVLLAVAGWLLARRTTSTTERRVFAMATLLLIGGAADSLSASPLFGGLMAGLIWQRLGGTSRETLHREILYVQHPFVVLVLIAAGARTELSSLMLGLGAAYVSVRAIARFASGALIKRLAPAVDADLRLELVAPGVFGVAFALNIARGVGSDVSGSLMTLSVIVLGTVLSDITARFVASRGSAA